MGGTAIKFLVESVTSRPSSSYARFSDEYRNLVKLSHKGVIVPLYYFGIQDMNGTSIPYIVMEHCSASLAEVYKSNRLTDATEFENLLTNLLEALDVVHESGIIHRDIKPENILLRPNKKWVLADFGISWFDPELHVKMAQTKPNARLANFRFSAPEQWQRKSYNRPMPSLDLYSLGQVLYYCATGDVIRGSNYPLFSQIVPQLSKYDPLIDKLVRQIPLERFQSVGQVRHFLKGLRENHIPSPDEERLHELYRQQDKFDLALRRSMPGIYRGYIQAKNKEEINRVLSSLAKYCKASNLWWFEDNTLSNSAYPMKKLSDDIWLIDHHECDISDLWIYRYPVQERQYVIIHLASRPTFGIYKNNNFGLYRANDVEEDYVEEDDMEEAAYYKGKYVTRSEYDDGYALIEGRIVKLQGAEIRTRNLKGNFLVLAPHLSVYNLYNHVTFNAQIKEVYDNLVTANKITPSLLEPLEHLKRPNWMALWD